MSDAIVLQCSQLTKRYVQGDLDVAVLKGVDLSIRAGQRLAIMGASGSGKSTLLHLLGGLEKPTSGTVILDGFDLNNIGAGKLGQLRNRSLGFIYQFHHLLGEFSLIENVAMPLLIGGLPVKEAQRQAIELLQRVGLGHRIQHKPGELSGGERQRAAVARALINKPKCVLADEPTGNLDRGTGAQVMDLLFGLREKSGTTLLLITHDPLLAERCGRQVRIEDGRVVPQGTRDASPNVADGAR